jgi:hypothetical protein
VDSSTMSAVVRGSVEADEEDEGDV